MKKNNTLSNPTETQNPAPEVHYEVSGLCYHVVDGDTIDVEGVGRIRLVGVNTPERGEPGYTSATDFVKSMVEGKTVYWISTMPNTTINMAEPWPWFTSTTKTSTRSF